ncbi:AsnC family transcriptional regulator [Desulforamulus profundi]|uniref:AsnC family transcriptional regulator n=1 Tax=Desulforamulus profundi TaxID=1383067 RepID=A0A2C6MHR2_9FIRM|nr:Lrp/AsnC family transcriptional regulator [Desulforamulus profundi]PHJ39305.1 AsnC family transcriptional regulator [Desulforamulus profundi]
MEDRGIIKGYTAVVEPAAVRCEVLAFIYVVLQHPDDRLHFLHRVQELPEVLECHHIAGEEDYLLKVRCTRIRDLEELVSEVIKGAPGVVKTKTTIALSTAKETSVLPLPFWVRLSTLDKGKPVYIPVQSNEYFEDIPGQLKNFCQFNLTKEGKMTVSFIKDKTKSKEYKPLTPKTALDLGLKSIFTTDRGDLFGRKFYETLLKYDGIITELARNRQKQGLK